MTGPAAEEVCSQLPPGGLEGRAVLGTHQRPGGVCGVKLQRQQSRAGGFPLQASNAFSRSSEEELQLSHSCFRFSQLHVGRSCCCC